MARRGSRLGQAVLDLIVDDSKFTSNLDKNKRKATNWVGTLNRDVKRGLAQGIGIGAGLGVANLVAQGIEGVKAVVVGSIQAAIEWESAFAGVRKTVDASEAEFADLEGAIRGMAKEIPSSTTELAGLAEAAGALGIAKGDIAEFTRVTAMIGTTTDVSSDQAATSLGQLSNVLGLTNEDYERFGSTLVDLGNKGASTESQILEIASRAGAGSKLIGMATDETLGWASAVANLGIEVEAGGTSLQKFFLDTAKAVSTGGEKLEKYAEVAGMTGSEFKRAFETDATGALRVFLAGLGELTQGEQLAALADLDFNDQRITRTLLGLANGTDMVAASLDTANAAWDENIALTEEAEKRYGTTESKLQILGNRVNDLAITFGEELLPGLVDFATFGVEAVEAFAEDVGEFFDDISDTLNAFDIRFGQTGATVERHAQRMGHDVAEFKNLVIQGMNEMNLSLEEAERRADQILSGIPESMTDTALRAQAAWKQADFGQMIPEPIEEGVAGAEAALLAGEEPLGDAAATAMEPISKEAQEQRALVIDAMKATIAGMANLFETDESVRDAWQGLIDRMDDPYTEAERKADIFSKATIQNIRDAITSGDPKVADDARLLVDNMLGQVETMEPGALASGEAVPPAIRDGMDASMSQLITWIEQTLVPAGLDSLTMDEADDIGLGNIWRYAQGMKANKEAARREAAAVAAAARAALNINTFSSGMDFIGNWAAGIDANAGTATEAVRRAVGGAVKNLPYSEPKDPKSPARGLGKSGEAFIRNIAAGMDPQPMVDATRRALAASLPLVPNLGPMVPSLPALPALQGMEAASARSAASGAMAAGSVSYNYHLNVNGEPIVVGTREEVLDEWERMARFGSRPH